MAVLDQVRPSTADARGATAKATPHRTVLLPIEGMTCASCVGRVERALKGVAGVSGVEVNLATERARVTALAGAVSPADLVEAIGGAGYDAASVAAQAPAAADQTAKDKAARRDFTHILLERRGDAEEARRYRAVAHRFAGAWLDGAKDGGSTRLAFDRPGSWSLKYNLVWDRLLGFGLFPLEELRREQEDYRTKVKAYGVPLDGRGTVTSPSGCSGRRRSPTTDRSSRTSSSASSATSTRPRTACHSRTFTTRTAAARWASRPDRSSAACSSGFWPRPGPTRGRGCRTGT